MMDEEILEGIEELKVEFQRLHTELSGIVAGAKGSEEKHDLRESTTLRQVVEQLDHNVNAIMQKINLDDPIKQSLKEALADIRVAQCPQIATCSVGEEEKFVACKFEKLRSNLVSTDGATLAGKTADAIQLEIPVDYLNSVTVVISNLLDADLTLLGSSMNSGVIQHAPTEVGSLQREVLSFHSNNTVAAQCYGAFCWEISGTKSYLALCCGSNDAESVCFGIALFSPRFAYPVVVQNLPSLLESGSGHHLRQDKKFVAWVTQPQESIVRLGKIWARARMTKGPKALLELELVSDNDAKIVPGTVQENDLSRTSRAPLINEISITGAAVDEVVATLSPARACIVEITNLLNVPLEDGTFDLKTYEKRDFMPYSLFQFSTRTFHASSDAGDVQGIFSFRIAATDLRLVVSFNVLLQGNSFTISFAHKDTQINQALMDNLNQIDPWVSRPDKKLVFTRDKAQVITMRNIEVWAVMTDSDQSILKIVIYTIIPN